MTSHPQTRHISSPSSRSESHSHGEGVRYGGSDGGSVSLLFAVLFAGALILVGIVVDADRAQHANAHASALAAKAARVGAQQVDPASIRAGNYHLNHAAARTAALAYLAQNHRNGTVQTQDRQITVTVTWPVRFHLLAPIRRGVTITQTRTVAVTFGP